MERERVIEFLRRWGPSGIAAMFTGSGLLHLVKPGVFVPTVPRALPSPTGIVYLSGAAELVCAAGLARRTRWAAPASAALLLAVLPANVQMALDATARIRGADSRTARRKAITLAVAGWVRVPMQAPLIWAALQARHR